MWVRGGIIGMWTVSTCSAGILGFERYKGTLVFFVSSRIDPRLPMAAVVSAASTFGLAAMPLAWVARLTPTGGGGLSMFSLDRLAWYVAGTLLLWVACLSVAFVIATVFVLTPNAIAYESMLLTPVLIASGVLFTHSAIPLMADAAQRRDPVALAGAHPAGSGTWRPPVDRGTDQPAGQRRVGACGLASGKDRA